MPTLSEAFQKWQATHHQLGYYPTQYEAAEAGFLAGAKAEREEVLAILDDLQKRLGVYGDVIEEVRRRIKERDNA